MQCQYSPEMHNTHYICIVVSTITSSIGPWIHGEWISSDFFISRTLSSLNYMVWSWEEASRLQGGYFTFHELVSLNWVTCFTSPVYVCVCWVCTLCGCRSSHPHKSWLQWSAQTEGMISVTISNPLKHLFYVYIILYVYVLIPLIPGHFNSDVLSVLCSTGKYWRNELWMNRESYTLWSKMQLQVSNYSPLFCPRNPWNSSFDCHSRFCASWTQLGMCTHTASVPQTEMQSLHINGNCCPHTALRSSCMLQMLPLIL